MLLCSIRKLCDTLAIRAHGEVWRGLLCTQYDGCIGAKARGHRSHNLAHTLETMSPRLYVCEVALHDVDGIHSLRNTGTHDTLHGELRPIREYTEKGERGSNEGKEAAPRQRKCFFFTLI